MNKKKKEKNVIRVVLNKKHTARIRLDTTAASRWIQVRGMGLCYDGGMRLDRISHFFTIRGTS
jgi:hypothetical protein